MIGRVAQAVRRAFLVGLIALALAAGGAWGLGRSGWAQRWATARIAAALGPSVRFAGARVALWPPPLAVELDGVELLGRDGTAIVRARHVRGRVRLMAVVGRPPLLARVTVDGFAADLTRAAGGGLRLGSRSLGDDSGAAATLGLDAECPRLDLADGRVTLRDASGGVERVLQIEAITGHLAPTRPGARIALAGRSAQLGAVRVEATLDSLSGVATAPFRAELEARDADAAEIATWLPRGDGLRTAGRARIALTLRGRPSDGQAALAADLHRGAVAWRDGLRVAAPIAARLQGSWGSGGLSAATGQLDAASIQAAGLEATAFRAAVAIDPRGVTLRDAHWRAFATEWRQSGTVRLADRVTLDGAVDADAADGPVLATALHQLLGDAAAPLRIDGPLRLHAAASGILGGPLAGQVLASMAAGTAGWGQRGATAPLTVSADAALDAGVLALRNGHAQAAAVGDRDLTATAVDARFAFADQALQVGSLTARAFDGDWALSGTIPLHGAPSLTLSATGVNAAHLARALLTGRREETGTAGDVDGTATLRGGSGRVALRLASPTLAVGSLLISRPASATGTLRWGDGGLRVDNGSAELARVRIAGTDVGDVRARFTSDGRGHLLVSPLTAQAFGGGWTVTGDLARDEIDGRIRASDVDLDALLAALDAGPRGERARASIEATVRRPRAGATTADLALQLLRGRFRFADLTVVGPARGTATLRLDGDRWAVANGVASASAASYAFLATTRPSANLAFDRAQIRFADLRFTAAGAPWRGSGAIDLDAPAVDGVLDVTGADPRAVLTMLGVAPSPLAPDALDLSLRARSPLDASWRQAARGDGTLTLRGGAITSTGLLRAIVAVVVPARSLREGGPPNRLASLSQTFTIADGLVRTADLTLDSDDYDLTAAGAIGLDGRLDLNGLITLTPNGIKKMFALSAVPIPSSSLWSLPPIPARFDGTLEKPGIHPEATALAGSTARWFADALLHAPRTIGQTVTRPLERMFDGIRDLVVPRTPTPGTGP